MKLTRRDALAALSAAGVGSLAGCNAPVTRESQSSPSPQSSPPPVSDDHVVETLVAVAAAVYPTAVDGVESFVRTYADRRLDSDDAYADGVERTVAALDEYAETLHDAVFVDLDGETQTETLDVMSVDVVDPDPNGTRPQRVRHFLVNELLYALYTSPTGASLAGLENPPGHPGGTASYQRGPRQ